MKKYTKREARAQHRTALKDCLETGVIDYIEIITAEDEHVCEHCRTHAGVYHINDTPPLPFDGCIAKARSRTVKDWCRCCLVAFFPEDDEEFNMQSVKVWKTK